MNTNQVEMVEYERSLIHLTQDQQNLVVNELFVLFQIAVHVLLELSADLRGDFFFFFLDILNTASRHFNQEHIFSLLLSVIKVTLHCS